VNRQVVENYFSGQGAAVPALAVVVGEVFVDLVAVVEVSVLGAVVELGVFVEEVFVDLVRPEIEAQAFLQNEVYLIGYLALVMWQSKHLADQQKDPLGNLRCLVGAAHFAIDFQHRRAQKEQTAPIHRHPT